MLTRISSVLLGTAVLASGCASNPWRESFQRDPRAPIAEATPTGAPVPVRDVPWPRLDACLREIEAERAADDTHVSQWPAERLDEVERRLVTALQAGEGSWTILGRSAFRGTERIDPSAGELGAFGRSIGADLVVWSSTYVGKADAIVDRPVTTFGTRTYTYRDDEGRTRSDTFNAHETTWVPVVVEADEHAWIAYYLKRDRD